MTPAVIVALGLAQGAPLAVLLVGVVFVSTPVPGIVAAVGWAAWRRQTGSGPGPDDEAAFLHRLSAELRGGASPRSALARAAAREQVLDLTRISRLTLLGLDDTRLAAALENALPLNGRMAGAALAVAGPTGAPLDRVVSRLAGRAARRSRLARETRSLTAQARATAWLVAGMPLALFAVLTLSGAVRPAAGAPVALAGLALQGAGVAVIVAMLRRSR